jgi:hypothetical protein
MKIRKMRWDFPLESGAGRVGMATVGLAFILGPLAIMLSERDFYPPGDIRANPMFWAVLGVIFAINGVVLLYRAIKGPPYPGGR